MYNDTVLGSLAAYIKQKYNIDWYILQMDDIYRCKTFFHVIDLDNKKVLAVVERDAVLAATGKDNFGGLIEKIKELLLPYEFMAL